MSSNKSKDMADCVKVERDKIVANSKCYLDELSNKINRTSPTKQILMGACSGFFVGFVVIRIGKTASLAIGGGIILLQLANLKGYVLIDLDKVNRRCEEADEELKKKATDSASWFCKMLKFTRMNSPFSNGLIGGFFLGLGYN